MRTLKEVKRAYVLYVLEQCDFDRDKARKILGISERGLRIYMTKEGLIQTRHPAKPYLKQVMRNVTPKQRDDWYNRNGY